MNKQKWFLLVVVLALIASGGGLLEFMRTHRKLGAPGVKTRPLADSQCLEVILPEKVLDYTSEWVEVDKISKKALPQDTSFGQRNYKASDGFSLACSVVLMGTDRTSLHKPQFCLEGAGWRVDSSKPTPIKVPVERPINYDLPVSRLLASREMNANGERGVVRGVYLYWYVADGAMSGSALGLERMWWMARELFRTGLLQRWAYISCTAICAPGQEEATTERMKQFIAAAVPEFQLTPKSPGVTAAQTSAAEAKKMP